MIYHTVALAALIQRCAPQVAPNTMAAIVRVESGGNPFAIGDNTTRRSYYPSNRASAETLAQRLLKAGHSIDLGVAQIDSVNFARFGVDIHSIFDACTNLNIGARIVASDHVLAEHYYGNGQVAVRHAIGMYNSGQLNAGMHYSNLVLAAAVTRQDDVPEPRMAWGRRTRSPLPVRVRLKRSGTSLASFGLTAPFRAPILITATLRVVLF
ncbi:MAG TPA: lytic transglycosylase domain-containing protein [Candidatus Tumulicola sp.]|jgi:type IV secretion system protein VirB1